MIHKIGFYFCHMSKWKINDFRNLCPKFELQTILLVVKWSTVYEMLQYFTSMIDPKIELFIYSVNIYCIFCIKYMIQMTYVFGSNHHESNCKSCSIKSVFIVLTIDVQLRPESKRAKLKKSDLLLFDPWTFGRGHGRVWIGQK